LVAAFENRKIEGLRQFVLDAWMEMTANSEFARNTMALPRASPRGVVFLSAMPTAPFFLGQLPLGSFVQSSVSILTGAVALIAAIFSVTNPERGIPDFIARTHLVPR
jgi:hypothetical protein